MNCIALIIFCFSALPAASQIRGNQLRLCRELNYSYQIDDGVAYELRVESKDAVRLDHQLVLKATELSNSAEVSQQCMFHWKQLMCSNVFRLPDGTAGNTAPPCARLCEKARESCFDQPYTICAESFSTRCTDYPQLTSSTLQQCISKQQSNPAPPDVIAGARPPRRQSGASTTILSGAVMVLAAVAAILTGK